MPCVAPSPPVVTTPNPLFVDRFASVTNSGIASFGDDETTGDNLEWRNVVSRTINPIGTGSVTLHTSHLSGHTFILRTNGNNTLLWRTRVQIAEGERAGSR